MSTAEQPAPVANDNPATWSLVIADMEARDVTPPEIITCLVADAKARDDLGLRRYGVRLQPFNGRDSLRDAIEEAMDLAVYLKNAHVEVETRGPDLRPGAGDYQDRFERGVLRCQYQAALSMCIHLRAAILRRDGK